MPGRFAGTGALVVRIVLVVLFRIELPYRIHKTAAIGAFPLVCAPRPERAGIEIGRVDVFGAHRGIGAQPIRCGE